MGLMENSDVAYIKYDLIAIKQLLEDYKATEQYILDELPDVNWNSLIETRDYFFTIRGYDLINTKIFCLQEALQEIKDCHDPLYHNEELIEELTGLIELKKIQSVIRNYLLQIIKHSDENGYYPLRFVNSEWVQQNKRDLSYCSEIQECIIEMHIPTGADKVIFNGAQGTKE